jgi:hypothetical protein
MRFQVLHLLAAMTGLAVVLTAVSYFSQDAKLIGLTALSYASVGWMLYDMRDR